MWLLNARSVLFLGLFAAFQIASSASATGTEPASVIRVSVPLIVAPASPIGTYDCAMRESGTWMPYGTLSLHADGSTSFRFLGDLIIGSWQLAEDGVTLRLTRSGPISSARFVPPNIISEPANMTFVCSPIPNN